MSGTYTILGEERLMPYSYTSFSTGIIVTVYAGPGGELSAQINMSPNSGIRGLSEEDLSELVKTIMKAREHLLRSG